MNLSIHEIKEEHKTNERKGKKITVEICELEIEAIQERPESFERERKKNVSLPVS